MRTPVVKRGRIGQYKEETTMKNKITLFATVLLATCLFAGSASAQTGYGGKFTLPFVAHWGKATLRPGTYLLTFTNGDDKMSNMLVIRDAKSQRIVAFEPVYIRDDSDGGKSALLIATRGTQHVVYSLRIMEVDQVFIYDRELAHAAAVEEARQTQAIPVFVTQK
jgi:hypothetical protein